MQSFGTRFGVFGVWGKILPGQIIDGGIPGKNATYGLKLLCLRMIDFGQHQRHLFFTHFACFVVAPDSILAVLFMGCSFTNSSK